MVNEVLIFFELVLINEMLAYKLTKPLSETKF